MSWALLGLVIERPSYGYELLRRFERTYGDTIELSSPSQVYVALDTLARKGLIEELPADATAPGVKRQPNVERQPKPHYRATAAGREGYEEWLLAQMRGERRRSHLFARQLAALEPHAALAVIARYEQACLAQAREQGPAALDEVAPLAERLAGEEERLAVDARLAWVEYARRELTGATAATARRARER